MSEPTQDPDHDAPLDTDEAAPPARPAPARLVLPPFVLPAAVVVLALGAGIALGSLLLAPPLIHAKQAAAASAGKSQGKARGKKKGKGGEGEAGKTPVYKLDNIVVNPAGSQGQRFLMCSVAIESDDAKALDELRAHEVEVRDQIVTTLSLRTLDQLMAPGARESLRADLLRVIHALLGPDSSDAQLKVYLPQFVVQ